MSNTKSIRERFNTIFNKGPERWLSRSLFEEDDALSRARADIESHRAQGFGRQGKPLPSPAIQQRMGSDVEPQEPDTKLDLSRGSQGAGAFQKPEERDYKPGEPQQRLNRLVGGRNQLIKPEFASLNSKLDWGNLDPNDPNVLEQVKDYGAHQLFYAQQLRDDIDTEEHDESLDDSLTYEQVQALMANKDRNISLFGKNLEDGEFAGRPDTEQTRLLQESMRPFKYSPDFVETTYNLLRQVFKTKEAFGGATAGGVNAEAPEAEMKDLLSVINGDVKEEDDQPIRPAELKKIFQGMMSEGDYKRPEREFFKGNRSHEERPQSARIQRVHDLMEVAMRHGSLGEQMRRGDSTSGHNEKRSRIMWKLFLEQGGREGMTGLPLDPTSMQLEHLAPAEREELRNPTPTVMDRFKQVDNDENYVLLNKAVNLAKNNNDMEGFYKSIVEPLSKITPEQFQEVGNLKGEAKGEVDNFMNDVMGSFFADGNFANENSSAELMSAINSLKERIGGISDKVFDNLEDKPEKLKPPTAPNRRSKSFLQKTMPASVSNALKKRDEGKNITDRQKESIRAWEEETVPQNEINEKSYQKALEDTLRSQEEFDNFDEDDFNERLNGYEQRKKFYKSQGKDKINGSTKNLSKNVLANGFGVGIAGHNPGQGSLQYGNSRLDRVLEKFVSDSGNLESHKENWNNGLSNGNRLAKLRDKLIRGDLEGEDLQFFENIINQSGIDREAKPAALATKYMDWYLDNNGF